MLGSSVIRIVLRACKENSVQGMNKGISQSMKIFCEHQRRTTHNKREH